MSLNLPSEFAMIDGPRGDILVDVRALKIQIDTLKAENAELRKELDEKETVQRLQSNPEPQ